MVQKRFDNTWWKNSKEKQGSMLQMYKRYHERKVLFFSFHSFTLIELLMVIAIIAILASMLLPTLKHAREMGTKTGCRNNLKQIGLITQMYSDDFDRHMPMVYNPAINKPWGYVIVASGYKELRQVLYCPTSELKTSAPDGFGWCYGMIEAPLYHGGKWNSWIIPDLCKGFQPEEVPYIMDSVAIDKQWYGVNCLHTQSVKMLHCRHLRKANVLWLDAHVTSVGLNEPPNWNWHPMLSTY